ncbi:acyltransferase family protein [Streptomyces brasiliensis]|uniref:Acyltransferase n=1 Tax=Streptomyces brasiliensis TaxID=1954 RepID=A0A917P350_9ACTN|nr:acyltransferase [Streptomyces brasiliensis]GGJ51443.1 acyltransferase [Streptomyces brasiliensis]
MTTDHVLTGSAPAAAAHDSAPAAAAHGHGPAAVPARPRPARLPSLTGLRFLAALAVFAHHAFLPIPPLRLMADDRTAYRLADWFTQAGGLGVSFFFVLSGFVLTWSAREDDTTTSFWRRRLVKIYPVYVVAWVLAMVLFAGSTTSTHVAVANLFMVQVWVPSYFTNFSVDSPSWSLGVEAVFYLCFPLLLHAARRIGPARLKYWITAVIGAVVATPALAYALFPTTPRVPSGQVLSVSQYWFAYVLPPVRMADFALGILVALAVRHGRWRDIGMVWSGLLLAGGYWLTFHVPYLYGQRAVLIVPIVLLIAATATADIEGRFTLFRNRTMVWLGEISFAFYLLHYIALSTLRKELGQEMYSTAATLSMLAATAAGTVLVSWVLYRLVEAPLVRRFGRARRTPAG